MNRQKHGRENPMNYVILLLLTFEQMDINVKPNQKKCVKDCVKDHKQSRFYLTNSCSELSFFPVSIVN